MIALVRYNSTMLYFRAQYTYSKRTVLPILQLSSALDNATTVDHSIFYTRYTAFCRQTINYSIIMNGKYGSLYSTVSEFITQQYQIVLCLCRVV